MIELCFGIGALLALGVLVLGILKGITDFIIGD